MPELPEVETIARALREGGRNGSSILGRTISGVTMFWLKTLAEPSADDFSRRVVGQSVLAVSRRAKYLVLSLSIDTLLLHLRMSGDVRVEDAGTEFPTHDRLHLIFNDGVRLAFNDPRKFGRIWLVEDSASILGSLGPEPFDPRLTTPVFHQMLQRTRRQIKPLLLDQSFIAGIGNIYSDEALHQAGIHPLVPADRISYKSAGLLLTSIRATLEDGIRRNGASIDWVYKGGDFQNYFRVYQRTGEPCQVCGTRIERRVIGQRSAHFCPVCQLIG
jgi:formamidopyrimidine-DNA glycosylase